MDRRNYTIIHGFILVGFSDVLQIRYLLFVIFLCTFTTSLLVHTLIISVYRFSPNLHTPMYCFLAIFSILEIGYLLSITPKLLINLLSKQKTISFYGCAIQMNCYILLGGTECCMLASMAYDRYNAICHPLLYNTIMRDIVCIRLVIVSWLSGATVGVVHTILVFSLPFCGSNRINNFYCDLLPLLSLACNVTQFYEIITLLLAFYIVVGPFTLTIISYANIIWTILKHHPAGMRKKTFSTCTSHLIVVCLFYGSGIIMYLRPKSSYGSDEEKFLSLMFTIIAPFCNPFIYFLRNNDVRNAVEKLISEIKKKNTCKM